MKILITGSTGLVGKNLINHKNACKHIILSPDSKDLNLLNKSDIESWLSKNEIEAIIHCAGLVGGIQANINNPSAFLFNNLQMGMNLINAALSSGVKNFINLGSSCMYPKNISHPIDESEILTGKLEETNEGYAIAKIATTKYCEYISKAKKNHLYKTIIPCNIYGKYDDFSPIGSHMIPGVIARIHDAKIHKKNFIEIWGDGSARREFMYAEDLAGAIWFCLEKIKKIPTLLNVGIGRDYSILNYYREISKVIGYELEFRFDKTKPIGMKRKLISSSKINQLGWYPEFSLQMGITATYNYYIKNMQK